MSGKITYLKKYGAICILDALGTKGIWKKKNPENVIENWEKFVNIVDTGIKKDKNFETNFYAFSDTIIITVSGNLPIEKVLNRLSVIVLSSITFGLPYGIFLRGCISIGDFYESEKMILGPAIDEASQHYEIANWLGVHLTPSAFSVVDRLISSDDALKHRFALYSVPVKIGQSIETYALALSNVDLYHFFSSQTDVSFLEEEHTLIGFIHYRLEHLDDVEGSDKWKNTLKYVQHMTKTFNFPLKPDS